MLIKNQLLVDLRKLLTESRQQLRQIVNTTMVQTYWEVGRLIVEDEQKGESRASYGKQALQQLSSILTKEYGKGFDVRNLRNMRSFFKQFPIRGAVRSELSWTHYRILLRVESKLAQKWYVDEAINQNWSTRDLERQISVLYYERLLSSSDEQALKQEAQNNTETLEVEQKDYLRDPYILDFLNLPSHKVLESDIEQSLINNLQRFLLELGKGFAFVERQQRISTADEDFYIDLVFYNFKLKCFLLIDLKVGKLNHQDVGQMDTYVRMYDDLQKAPDDNATIGLILCSEKSEAVAKYSVLVDGKQLFASKYLPYLPTEEELKKQLERDRRLIMEKRAEYIA